MEKQIIYLDFDGAETTYNNSALGLNLNVTVKNSEISQDRIDAITAQLNRQYADDNIIFITTPPPEAEEYSTVFIGNSNNFSELGDFYGLSETIDNNNHIHNDDAFVLLDNTYSDAEIISVIAHETEHLTTGDTHHSEQKNISNYAMDKVIDIETFSFSLKVDGRAPDTIVAESKYWTPDFPANATKAVITVNNQGIESHENMLECDSNIYVYSTTKTYIIKANNSISFTLYSDNIEFLEFTRSPYLITEAPWPSYKYLYGYVKNTITVTVQYYSNIPIANLKIKSTEISGNYDEDIRIAPNEFFTYKFTIANTGDSTAGASYAGIYVDGEKFADVLINALSAGMQQDYYYIFSAASLGEGTHNIYIKADIYESVNELNSSDNSSSLTTVKIEPPMADLSISDFLITDIYGETTIATDREFKISAKIKNNSRNKTSDKTTVNLYADNEFITSFTLKELSPKDETSIDFSFAAGTFAAGERSFKLIIDPNDTCEEYYENNNTSTITTTVYEPLKPDLKLYSVVITDLYGGTKLHANQKNIVNIKINNFYIPFSNKALQRTSQNTYFTLRINGIDIKNFYLPSLEPAEIHEFNCIIPEGIFSHGENIIEVLIDPDNLCDEKNKDNNNSTQTKLFHIDEEVDFAISNITTDTISYFEKTFSFTISNHGNKTSQYTIGTLSGSVKFYEFEIAPLAPGESRNYQFSFNQKTALSHSFSINIDPNNVNNDINSENNTYSDNFYVNGPLNYNNRVDICFETNQDHIYSGNNIFILSEAKYTIACNISPTLPINETYIAELYSGKELIKTFEFINSWEKWHFLSFNTNILGNGKHTLRIHIYEKGSKSLNEYEYMYDWYTFNATVTGGRNDLAIPEWNPANLIIDSAKIQYSQNVENLQQLTFTVKNTGDTYTSYKYYISLYDNGKFITKYLLPIFEAEENKTFTFSLTGEQTLSSGRHNLQLQLEQDDTVKNYNFSTYIAQDHSNDLDINIYQKDNGNNTVTISADFYSYYNLTSKQYSINLSDWQDYTEPFTVSENCIVHFKIEDSEGNKIINSHNIETLLMPPTNLIGTSSAISWDFMKNANFFTVQYSKNNFENVFQINISGNEIDSFGMLQETYQWRVAVENSDDWSVGNSFSGNYQAAAAPEIIKSNNNGNIDLFFAKKQGIWKKSYVAKHQGIQARWIGTSETVSLFGKNKISDIFIGSNDDNILVLTDDANGDALFVDDIYTALGNQARLNKIDEIRAGAGDDIIDMTSQRFEYSNNSMSIFGGSGNDVIWGNNSSNLFFGDAGNDRIVGGLQADIIIGGSGNDQVHGGGGTDIFTFSENWGRDTVEQLVNGNVILWFESGSMNNWNERTLTYKNGNNTVTVKGINADQVYLLFGNEDDMFADFASAGAFDDFISEKIFEDADKNLIA